MSTQGVRAAPDVAMSTQGVRAAPVRGGRRRKTTLNLDLNSMPPESRDNQEGTSVQASGPAMIDLEAIDDDVIESSPRAFAAAKNNRRNHRIVVVDDDDDSHRRASNNQKRRRTTQNQIYINLDSGLSKIDKVKKAPALVQAPPPPPPPPPKELTFSCPICMCPMVEEMTTKCGHIFCKGCIKAAIKVQAKCPTCRKKVTGRELFRVFLPSTSCQ